ncbi:MAG TPA: dTDP-4-dehydrorhamnose reductase [Polyangiaceae bacterium]|nr:dTDP-4-dehydrorhamnose reductase [Polyangiaceae bacterium]
MRTLIIGTSGQLATELHRQGDSMQVHPAQKVDVTDEGAVRALLDGARPSLVINASAYTAVDRAEQERERAFAVNGNGPRFLARWCAANGAALIHVSTDYVFDGTKANAYVEDDAVGPLNVYGESKLGGEVAIREELPEHLIVRTSWVFSAHGQNFVKSMLRLARERDELRIVSDQSGRPTAASDLARALLTLAGRLASGETIAWGTYHFAGAGETTWHGFAQAIIAEQAAFTGRRPLVTAIASSDYPTPARRPANSVLDTSLFERTFGVAPRSWRDDLGEVVRQIVTP